MRAGEITSCFETGEGEDADIVRLTFFHRYRWVRLTCGKDGTGLTTSRVTSARP
ncbi:DUF6522 family protein [Phaeobacter porticola]|uniref:DUF6522 family protein n=1 Tax=Phaeobacter porticola TaxID=1844006 RepID=UPI000A83F21C|nr:DUF6522 family protein [Phaeobacter porticola]